MLADGVLPMVQHFARPTQHRSPPAALRPDQRLAIDGGVNPATAPACLAAGCDVLLAATAIFGSQDYAGAVAALRGGAGIVSGSR